MTEPPLDLLVVAAHPDDAELSVGGLLALQSMEGRRCGVIDLSAGERGSRGDRAARGREAAAAAEVLGLVVRENLGLPDARLEPSVAAREALAARLRAWRPRLLIGHGEHPGDPHPDHRAAARLTREAWFVAGLAQLDLGAPAHRPARRLCFAATDTSRADLVVPIDRAWDRKLAALACHASQMAPGAVGRVAGPEPLADVERRARELGARIGCEFAEGLDLDGSVRCDDPLDL